MLDQAPIAAQGGDDTGPLVPTPPRLERAGIEFPEAAWTSFDRYSRYGAIVRAVRANLGAGRHVVLDVGDSSGHLVAFDPELKSIGVDVEINPRPLVGTVAVHGDGARLPVPDRAVPAVVSSDALEHVAPDRRAEFLAELARASENLVVVAAPFDTPGVAGAEEFARRYVLAVTGAAQPQLVEHAEHGLPSLEESVGGLERAGLTVEVCGNGNLHDWLLGMLIKHQLMARPPFTSLDLGFDILYNLVLSGRNHVPPFYRHVIVGSRAGRPSLGEPDTAVEGPVEASALLGALLAANAAEVARLDTGPTIARILSCVDEVHMQQEQAFHHFMDRFEGIEQALAAIHDHVTESRRGINTLLGALGHPLREVRRRLRTRAGRPGPPRAESQL